MTTGYNDFQSYPNWRGPAIWQGPTACPGNSTTTLAESDVSQYGSVLCNFQCNDSPCYAGIEFWTDDTYTSLITSWSWVLNPGAYVTVLTPCPSNAMVAFCQNNGATTENLTGIVIPQNLGISDLVYPSPGGSFSLQNVSVPAGSSVTYPFTLVRPGRGAVYFNPHDTDGDLAVSLIPIAPSGGNDVPMWRNLAPTAEFYTEVWFPAQPVTFEVTNSDASNAHIFSAFVTQGSS